MGDIWSLPILFGSPTQEIRPKPKGQGEHAEFGMRTYPNGATQWYALVREQSGQGRHRG